MHFKRNPWICYEGFINSIELKKTNAQRTMVDFVKKGWQNLYFKKSYDNLKNIQKYTKICLRQSIYSWFYAF